MSLFTKFHAVYVHRDANATRIDIYTGTTQ